MINQAKCTSLLKSITKVGLGLAHSVTLICEFGFDVFAKSGNADVLTKLVDACVDSKSVKASHVVAFITEHTNLKYVTITNKDGVALKVFKKRVTGENPMAKIPLNADGSILEVFDWAGDKPKADKLFDAYAKLSALVTSINSHVEKGDCVDVKLAKELRVKLVEVQNYVLSINKKAA